MSKLKILFYLIFSLLLNFCSDEIIDPPLIPIKTLKLISPDGGENLTIGDTTNISWESENISNLKISYSIDGGLNWRDTGTEINSQEKTIPWIVPNSITTTGLIKIEDVDDPTVKDISNNFFSIVYNPALENLKYYPLNIGDEWRYFTSQWNYEIDSTTISDSITIRIIGDTLMPNGYNYFIYNIVHKNNSSFTKYVRLDSTTAQVFIYNFNTGTEQESWPFGLPSGSYWQGYNVSEGYYLIQYINYSDRMKSFSHSGNGWQSKYVFVKNIGEAYNWFDDRVLHIYYTTYLIYAKINGVVYGKLF